MSFPRLQSYSSDLGTRRLEIHRLVQVYEIGYYLRSFSDDLYQWYNNHFSIRKSRLHYVESESSSLASASEYSKIPHLPL